MYPYPIIEIGAFKVYPYGVFIALGILACLISFYVLSKKLGVPSDLQDFVFYVVVGALAGGFTCASLLQSFYNWLAGKPFELFSGGITVMGGLIGGAGMFLLLYFTIGKLCFKGDKKDVHKKHFNSIFKIAPICIVLAHAFGRIGCLMGGCCHGQYLGSDPVSGGIWMLGTVDGFRTWGYYIPAQLYEAIFLFVLAIALIILLFKRCNITMHIYLISYGVWRFILEYIRTDDRGGLPGLTPSQWTSILFVLAGVGLIVLYVLKKWPLFVKNKQTESLEEPSHDKESV